jgi:dihydroflavonol-4-reductase
MTNKWTLVTGASGFIGSAVVRRLVERGDSVKAFVRPGSDLRPFLGMPADRLQLAFGDITVQSTVYRALVGCERLFHVASVFRYWSRNAAEIIQPAVQGTRAVLGAVRQHHGAVERVVVTSSAGVLGTDAEEMDETHEFNLSDPELYLRAKVEQEAVVSEFIAENMPIVSVLPSGVFGPGDRKPTPNGRAIIEYLKQDPNRRLPATEGGISVVDVDDVAEGHVLAMERGRIGERYILGGENLTYRALIELLHDLTGLAEPGATPSAFMLQLAGRALELYARFTGRDPLLTAKLARDFAASKVWVTSAKAEAELGYRHRSAREALARSIRWYLANGYLQEPLAGRVRLELRPV